MTSLNTVLGPIDASQVGATMSHVHLTINILCWHQTPDSGVLRGLSDSKITLQNLGLVRRNAMLFKDNLVQDDLDLAIREAAEYKFTGGQTLINVDLPGMGRDPLPRPDGSARIRQHAECGNGEPSGHPAQATPVRRAHGPASALYARVKMPA